MTKEQAIKSFKKYIIFQESTLNDYYKIDEEFYKDQIEQLELSTTLLKTVLSMLEEQDKIIDLMLEEISKNILNTCLLEDYNYDLDCENKCNNNYKECWKQYFKNQAKELLNK